MAQIRQQKDTTGSLIKLFIILIIWYSECIQQRYFQINNFLLIVGAMLVILVMIDYNKRKLKLITIIQRPCIWMIVFMIYMLTIPSIFAVSFSRHISQWITSMEYFIVMICVVYICRTRNCTDFLISNYMIMYTAMCIIFLISPVAYKGLDNGRYSFGGNTNPNGFAIGLTTGIFSTLYLVSRKKIPLIAGLGMSCIFLFAILQTGSRKGLIGSILCVVLWIVICYIPSVPRKQGYKSIGRFVLIVALISVALFIIMPYYENSTVAKRMTYAVAEMTSGGRNDMYSAGLEIWRQSPVFGVGFQGFSSIYSTGQYSHATLVEVPVSGGIVGVLFYMLAYFTLLRSTLKMIIRDRRTLIVPDRAYFQHRMALIMLSLLLVNFICIIHPYQLDSNVNFGLAVAFCYGSVSNSKKLSERKSEC